MSPNTKFLVRIKKIVKEMQSFSVKATFLGGHKNVLSNKLNLLGECHTFTSECLHFVSERKRLVFQKNSNVSRANAKIVGEWEIYFL